MEKCRYRRIGWPPPWWVWPLLVPALLIELGQVLGPHGERVDVLGAGPVASLSRSTEVPGVRLVVEAELRRPLTEAAEAVRAALHRWPRVVVLGIDTEGLSQVEARSLGARLHDLVKRAQRAAVVVVSVAPTLPVDAGEAERAAVADARTRWRTSTCRAFERVLCVDVQPHLGDEAEVRAALEAAAQRAVARLRALQATTQRGRAAVEPEGGGTERADQPRGQIVAPMDETERAAVHPVSFYRTTRSTPRSSSDVLGGLGVIVELHPETSRQFGLAYPPPLEPLLALGIASITLPVPWRLREIGAHDISPGRVTPPEADVRRVARHARALGLDVRLLPMLILDEGGPGRWRGALVPAFPERFWAAYARFVRSMARLAKETDASLLYIGSELTSLGGPDHAQRWRAVAEVARGEFGGLLGYATNHDALDRLAAARWVDVVGVSAYFPLSTAGRPSQELLDARWSLIARLLRNLSDRLDRPVVLTEVGFPSVEGALRRPWDAASGRPIDLEAQRRGLAAVRRALAAEPRLREATIWSVFGPGGAYDAGFSPLGKPAEEELRRWARSDR